MINDAVVSCGQKIGAGGDTVDVYYGAADSSVSARRRQHSVDVGVVGFELEFNGEASDLVRVLA